VLLAREGLLESYESPVAAEIPPQYRDPEHRWIGFALRARVVAYDPKRTTVDDLPRTWEELADPRFAGVAAIANPLFGTTRGHVAAMYSLWGPQRFRAFLTGLVSANVTVADGNATAVRKLIAGDIELAFTDSDDVITARRRGHQLEMIFPDMGDGGTMLIPNTVALVAGAPHEEAARQLIDFLLSAEVEEMLARSDSANYPVRESLRRKLGMELPPASGVGYDDIAEAMPASLEVCREILLK
jgi:iron(III) transport system substrate-binding protein